MRILALDHGAARVGAAICDPTETDRGPLGVRRAAGSGRGRRRSSIEHEAELVVVGLPVSLSGRGGPAGRRARAPSRGARELLDVPVETYDERLTTRMADVERARGSGRAD